MVTPTGIEPVFAA